MKIGIIGLGLIGGSILKSLANKDFEIYAVSGNSDTCKKAGKYCIKISKELDILKDCEVVFVAVPMSKMVDTLHKLEKVLHKDTIVTDVASLKSFVMQEKYSFDFVGSHPMAGTEFSGYDYSSENMFAGAKWVITPYKNTQNTTLKTLESVIVQTGANTIYTDAKSHDSAVAKISHMPMLLSQALVDSIKDDDLARKLASSGFRDMTRLALSNADMAEDMINMNMPNIENALSVLNNSINSLKKNYKKNIMELKVLRQKMYDKNGKNIF